MLNLAEVWHLELAVVYLYDSRNDVGSADYHAPSLAIARSAAKQADVDKRITFRKASAKDFPAKNYDVVAMFDCLHDMGDPVGAAKHVKNTLAKDGTFMLVEPFAHDELKDNLNPVGRVLYAVSTMICTPASLSQEVGLDWARRRAKNDCTRSHARPVFRDFAAQRRHRSISCSKRVIEIRTSCCRILRDRTLRFQLSGVGRARNLGLHRLNPRNARHPYESIHH